MNEIEFDRRAQRRNSRFYDDAPSSASRPKISSDIFETPEKKPVTTPFSEPGPLTEIHEGKEVTGILSQES